MPLIEFLNTVSFYSTQWKSFNLDLKKSTTFEGAVLQYLSKF